MKNTKVNPQLSPFFLPLDGGGLEVGVREIAQCPPHPKPYPTKGRGRHPKFTEYLHSICSGAIYRTKYRVVKVLFFALLLLVSGCSPSYFEKSADKEVQKILIQTKEQVAREHIPADVVLCNDNTDSETRILTLKDVLILATQNNRSYKTTKENVYLKALDLTYQRYLFSFQYSIGGQVYWNKNGSDNVSGNLDLNLVKWLAGGTQIALDLSTTLVNYLTGSGDNTFQTIISLDLLQPLFKGAGREIAQANLIQAERDMVYEIRSFLKYQKDFSADVAGKYLDLVLKQRVTENYWTNYMHLKNSRERIEMLSQAGRIPVFQVGQARQQEYESLQKWVEYKNTNIQYLDAFKVFLGLPIEEKIELDNKDMEYFIDHELEPVTLDLDKFIKIALKKRLDLITSYDQIFDAERDVRVALNGLRTKVNLNVTPQQSIAYGSSSSSGNDYKAGLDFDLPVNKISERNAYKEALINLERKKRAFNLQIDTVKEDVIDSYRALQSGYESYLVQKASLALAIERVASASLLQDAGRATTRDLLDSQDAHISAKNSLVKTIVDYLTSYIDLLNNAELLELDKNGVWTGKLYEKFILKEGESKNNVDYLES